MNHFSRTYTIFIRSFIIFSIVCGSLMNPGETLADPVIRSGDTVSVDTEQVIDSDFYGMGRVVVLSGTAKNDVYVLGGSVTTNAPVGGDLGVIGGTVQVHGQVADDVRVIGGDVTIAESVEGDVLVLGGALSVLSSAKIHGNIIFLGNELTIDGPVDGSILANASVVRINSEVKGDATVRASNMFTVGDKAIINGSVHYTSVQEMARAQNATINGEIKKTILAPVSESEIVKGALAQIFVVLFAMLSLFFIMRGRIEALTEDALAHFGKRGLIGLGLFIALPIIGAILLVSVLGSLVGVLVLLVYVLLVLLSLILSGPLLGSCLQRLVAKKRGVTLFSSLVGTVVYSLLIFIPFVGPIIMIALFLVVMGSLLTSIYQRLR